MDAFDGRIAAGGRESGGAEPRRGGAQRDLSDRRRHGPRAGLDAQDRERLCSDGVRPGRGHCADLELFGQQSRYRFGGGRYGPCHGRQDRQLHAGPDSVGRAADIDDAPGLGPRIPDGTCRYGGSSGRNPGRLLCPCQEPPGYGGHSARHARLGHRRDDRRRMAQPSQVVRRGRQLCGSLCAARIPGCLLARGGRRGRSLASAVRRR